MFLSHIPQRLLCLVKFPPRCKNPSILIAVRIPKHYLLQVASLLKILSENRKREQFVHYLSRPSKIINSLKERDYINACQAPVKPGLFCKKKHCQYIAYLMGHTDNIGINRVRAVVLSWRFITPSWPSRSASSR